MKRLRLMVVDDDRDFAEALSMVLESKGHVVQVAYDGQQAIEAFGARDFDLAFMDVRLPGMNGVESFLEIRKLYPQARVVMMTGYGLQQLLDQAVANGAWGILRKPLDMDRVLEMLEIVRPEGILIVDDDPDFLQSLKDVLNARGWKVFVASNGREAIKRVRDDGIDILILDLRMPVLGGLDTYLELKRMGRVIPTIIITAFAEDEAATIERLLSLSVAGILRKPFDPHDLIRAVEALARAKAGECTDE